MNIKLAQEQVREFMIKAGQECPAKPTIPSLDTVILRKNLIDEEVNDELLALLELLTKYKYKQEEILIQLSDALTDSIVVILGTAIAFGIDLEPVWNEVHRSNMTKFIAGYKREDGKWMKGPSYERPRLKEIIDKQLL
jgi:predicted HAD superfamily Cof-like phosphohydrolase